MIATVGADLGLDVDNPLVRTMEDDFHCAANSQVLKDLHRRKDWNGLLEYALLLAETETAQRAQIRWLAKEAADAMAAGLQQWHLDAAAELLEAAREEPS